MKEHPGHFFICLWLLLIWLSLPSQTWWQEAGQSLSKIAAAVEQTTAPRQ